MTETISTIIGSDKGGVGKSMISTILTLIFDKSGIPLSVFEVDNQKKLSSVFPNRVNRSFPVAPSITDITKNKYAAESFFNPLYMEWRKGRSLTDLGANVTSYILEWMKQCEINEIAKEDGIKFKFSVCASPDEQAIKSALNGIEQAKEILGYNADYYVIFNDTVGNTGFLPYERLDSFKKIISLSQTKVNDKINELNIINVPYCDSILLEYGKSMSLNPIEIVDLYQDVAKEANLDDVFARSHKKKLVNWLINVQTALTDLVTISITK